MELVASAEKTSRSPKATKENLFGNAYALRCLRLSLVPSPVTLIMFVNIPSGKTSYSVYNIGLYWKEIFRTTRLQAQALFDVGVKDMQVIRWQGPSLPQEQ